MSAKPSLGKVFVCRTNECSFMPLIESQWAAAGAPRDAKVRVKIQLTDASRHGRALVASCRPSVASRQSQSQNPSPSASRLSQSQPPSANRQPPAASRLGPGQSPAAYRLLLVASRRTAEQHASETFAEDKQNRAIARFRPFVRIAAVSATIRESRSSDHYGLGRHLADNARQARSPEGRPRESRQPDSR